MRIVVYLTLGVLFNAANWANQTHASTKDVTAYHLQVSAASDKTDATMQNKSIVSSHLKKIMIGGVSLLVAVIAVIALLEQNRKKAEHRETQNAYSPRDIQIRSIATENIQSVFGEDQVTGNSTSLVTKKDNNINVQEEIQVSTKAHKQDSFSGSDTDDSQASKTNILYGKDGRPLIRIPLEALKFRTNLPEKAKEIVNSFSWTQEGREKARTDFAHSDATQEFLSLLEGIPVSVTHLPYLSISSLRAGDPSWIGLQQGINIQAKCSNPNCPSHQATDYRNQQSNYVLIHYRNEFNSSAIFKARCPIDSCRRKMKLENIENIFMYECSYQLQGEKYANPYGLQDSEYVNYHQEGNTNCGERVTRFWLGGNQVVWKYYQINAQPYEFIEE